MASRESLLLAALSTKKNNYTAGQGTYLSGSRDLGQHLLLLGHLQPLQPCHMSHHMVVLLGSRNPQNGITSKCCTLVVRQVRGRVHMRHRLWASHRAWGLLT